MHVEFLKSVHNLVFHGSSYVLVTSSTGSSRNGVTAPSFDFFKLARPPAMFSEPNIKIPICRVRQRAQLDTQKRSTCKK